MFAWLIFLILGFLIFQLGYLSYHFYLGSKLAKTNYSRKTQFGNSSRPVFKLFVDGDSIAAGVGASRFESSVAGRLVKYFEKNYFLDFESIGKSGKKVIDVLNSPSPESGQDLIVLIVSSNNLFRLTNLNKFEKETAKLFEKYSPLAKKILLVGPGRVGDSKAIPFFLRPYYRFQGKKYAEIIKKEVKKFPNVTHINPQEKEASYEKYGYTLAADKFHPNDKGHEFWFDLIVEGLETQTPGG